MVDDANGITLVRRFLVERLVLFGMIIAVVLFLRTTGGFSTVFTTQVSVDATMAYFKGNGTAVEAMAVQNAMGGVMYYGRVISAIILIILLIFFVTNILADIIAFVKHDKSLSESKKEESK